MSATKHYIDTNCYHDESTGTFKFNDGYPDIAPEHIMRQRLYNAGLLKHEPEIKRNSDEPFKYNCDDLTRHQFYQAINSNCTVQIDEEWYNTYLDMQQPSHWLCTVKWYEKGAVLPNIKLILSLPLGMKKSHFG